MSFGKGSAYPWSSFEQCWSFNIDKTCQSEHKERIVEFIFVFIHCALKTCQNEFSCDNFIKPKCDSCKTV